MLFVVSDPFLGQISDAALGRLVPIFVYPALPCSVILFFNATMILVSRMTVGQKSRSS